MNENDNYVIEVLSRHQSAGSLLVARSVIGELTNSIDAWANGHLYGVYPAGSVAKGTAISESSDVDILISVKITAVETLQEVYEKLFNRLTEDGYAPSRQNVSLGIKLGDVKVDIVPGKKQSNLNTVHSLWSHKTKTRRETDIHQHIRYVTESNRINEIKLVKIWKKLHSLEFPSFPLEVITIDALHGRSTSSPAANFVATLEFIRDSLPTARIIDPTKPSNILSDELTSQEKTILSNTAGNSLDGRWGEVLW